MNHMNTTQETTWGKNFTREETGSKTWRQKQRKEEEEEDGPEEFRWLCHLLLCSLLFDKISKLQISKKRKERKRRSLPHTIYIQLEREKSSAFGHKKRGSQRKAQRKSERVKERCFFHVNTKSLFKSYICMRIFREGQTENHFVSFSHLFLSHNFSHWQEPQTLTKWQWHERSMYLRRLCLWKFSVEGSVGKSQQNEGRINEGKKSRKIVSWWENFGLSLSFPPCSSLTWFLHEFCGIKLLLFAWT